MDEPRPVDLDIEQPPVIEEVTADGVFIKQITLRLANTIVPQHSHKYDHTSFLSSGSVRVWEDGVYRGELSAPRSILIKAGTMHKFLTLEPMTTILCIHNFLHPDAVAIVAENGLAAGDI